MLCGGICVRYRETCKLGAEGEGSGEERRSDCKLVDTNFERTLTHPTASSNAGPVPPLFSQ